jgi:two-component system, LytTR family, response regulator
LSARPLLLRTLIVEDEPLARENLREFIAGIDWITLIGEAADGKQAIKMIDQLKPDLVFLDVSLPEWSGMQVIERICHQPEIVFTTAHDEFALAAFETGALDYLLKPFGRKRFGVTLERVRKRLLDDGVPTHERANAAFAQPLKRLFARTRDGIVPIETKNIDYLNASGDYVEVVCGSEHRLLHMGLADLLARLDPDEFLQVHRSHAVNLNAIERLVAYDARRFLVRLRSGKEILASRAASESLRRLVR